MLPSWLPTEFCWPQLFLAVFLNVNTVSRFSLSPGFTVNKFCDFKKKFCFSLCGFQEELRQDSELSWHHISPRNFTTVFIKEKRKKTAIIFSSKSIFNLSKKGMKNEFGLRFEADIVIALGSSQSTVF